MQSKNDHMIVKLVLGIYVCIVFALAIFIPVFHNGISEEGKFGLYFLQDTGAIWVSALLGYYFGSAFLKFYLNKTSRFRDENTEREK